MVSSEVRDPARNLPRSLILRNHGGYRDVLLINLRLLLCPHTRRVAGSQRLAANMMSHLYGSTAAAVVAVAVLISIFAALKKAEF